MGSPVEVGSILAGKYRVERTIGTGGMGVVVEANDTRLERRVAIKFLLPDYAEHGEAASRFMREARAAVKIKSDHTARVIDVGTLENGSPYMVMEYLEGADLAQILERDGVLGVEDAALYVIQACEAVAEAHSHGIVHRDLKPANLFLAQQPDGSLRIKVLDFGISKVVDAQVDHSLTRTSSMMGSPLYMSPEQMRSTRNVDLRTDIWALGVIFYEMVTGSLPFIASSVPELSAKVLLEAHEPLSSRRPDLPVALERIVTRALCKNPAERYPSIAEFAMDLLPFAPHRARNNVERITKVLNAAGLSTSRFKASVPPAPLSTSNVSDDPISGATMPGHDGGGTRRSRSSVVVVDSASLPDATQVNFGQTSAPSRSGRVGLLAALLLGVVALVGGAAFIVTGSGTAPGPEPTKQRPAAQGEAEVQPAMRAADAPGTAPAAIEPSVAASVESPATETPPMPAAPEPSATETAPAPHKHVKQRSSKAKSQPRSGSETETAPKAAPVATDDSFGQFGGRK